jgi:predicted ribosomally synthesized peptide with nif11-like leader
MSEEQLRAFLEAVKADAGLQEKLKGAADLDAAVALAKEAGFDVSKADWLKYQENQTLELSDEELEGVAGGALRDQQCVKFATGVVEPNSHWYRHRGDKVYCSDK